MATDYTTAKANALAKAFPLRVRTDPLAYSAFNSKRWDAKYGAYEFGNELAALVADALATKGYSQSFTCLTGLAVGEPVRISAANTVVKSLATTAANAKVFGFVDFKGTLGAASDGAALNCYITHYLYKSGLSGLTAGNPVYLSDTGTYTATAGTVVKVVGLAISTTEALLVSDGLRALGVLGIGAMTADDIALTDQIPFHDASGGDENSITVERLLGYGLQHACTGRLTGTTAVPITTSDVTGAATIYFTPYKGARIGLYDGTRWKLYALTELSNVLANTSTGNAGPAAVSSGNNYDLFVWDDGGTVRLTRGPAWSSATSRGTGAGTTEIELVDGIYVNKVAITNGPTAQKGRYVGSIRGTGSSTTEDSKTKRFIWNLYNQVPRSLLFATQDSSNDQDTITGTPTSWTQINGTFQVEVLTGIDGSLVDLEGYAMMANNGAGNDVGLAIAVTSATNVMARNFTDLPTANQSLAISVTYNEPKAAGYLLYMLCWAAPAGTATLFLDAGGQSGETASVDPMSSALKGVVHA